MKGGNNMSKVFNYLASNPEVVSKLKSGEASLVSVSKEEQEAIVAAFEKEDVRGYYWRA